MHIDLVLWLACSATEAAVIGLLIYRRMWHAFPLFFAYSIWTLAGSAGLYVTTRIHLAEYLTASLLFILIDSTLLFGVLVELGMSILRPLHSSLPRVTTLAVAILILALGAAIWPFVGFPGAAGLPREGAVLTHIQQDFSVLRVLVFLALACFSQVLSISWRDRELQIATGLGFTSIIGLAVAAIHEHQTKVAQWNSLNRLVVAAYLCSLFYWVISFAHKEQERRPLTPQMESMLLAVAGAARATRTALSRSPNK